MGQVIRCLLEAERQTRVNAFASNSRLEFDSSKFPDLRELPPELSLSVLSYLNATDLCLAACVWQSLANDKILWHG